MKLTPLVFNLFAAIFLFSNIKTFAQAPSIQWQKSLGGTGDDKAICINPTSDGGYIFTGSSSSNDGDVSGNHGGYDCWVVKINDTGAIQWQKSYGGTSTDYGNYVAQTSDGGYIVAAASYSSNGDVTVNHGGSDYWIIKLDDTGRIQWQKSFGGSGNDIAFDMAQINDGGYIVTGISNSANGDVSGNHGGYDLWVIKLDDTGALKWQKPLGGSSDELGTFIKQTSDNGFIVSGGTYSNDGDVTGNHGKEDYWVVKLNDTGLIQWQKTLGGSDTDHGVDIQQTLDGGYILNGFSSSNDGDVTGNHGRQDYWVVKLNDTGAIQWQKSLGGSNNDESYSIRQTWDKGYIVAGGSWSNDGNVSGNHGISDYWLVKLDSLGYLKWQKSMGGSFYDIAYSSQQTLDGGYIVAGNNGSNDGNITGFHGGFDCWIVKLTCGLNAGNISGMPSVCSGASITLTDTSTGGTWSMSNGDATISGGIVTGVGPGADTAAYGFTNTCGSAVAMHVVTVDAIPAAGTITGQDSICKDSVIMFTNAMAGGIWSSSDTNKAVVSSGMVRGKTIGTCTIKYFVSNTCGSDSTEKTIHIVNCTTEVNSLKSLSEGIAIFPNPVQNELTISSPYPIKAISITNILGQAVCSYEYNANEIQLHVADLRAGVYLIRINGTEIRTFLKE